jgi:DinB superfamily
MIGYPERTEAAEYYFRYIDQVPRGDICTILAAQHQETLAELRGISEERSRHRYAPGKWSIREVLGHINDTERLFVARAFWFARGFDTPLPSFDQNVAVAAAAADERSWNSHVEEFDAVRGATLSFFRNLPGDAWARRGIASDNPFTVRALAYLAAGHVVHHLSIVRNRYL